MPEGENEDGKGKDENVTLTKAEHDALQAKLRKLEKAEKDRKTADAKAAADAEKADLEKRLKEAEDAGIGKELREAEAERDTLKAKLQRVETRNAIRDAAGGRTSWSKSAQRSAARMIDFDALERDEEGVPTEESLTTALDKLEKDFPDIYAAGEKVPGKKGSGKEPVKTPSTPTGLEEKGGDAHFEGFVSQEEYADTPFETRNTPEFQERVAKSEPYWPSTFDHRELAQG